VVSDRRVLPKFADPTPTLNRILSWRSFRNRASARILSSKAGEFIQELLPRLALTLFYRRETVKGIKWPRLTVSRMIRARSIQFVRSPKIKWPTTSNALQVSFPWLLRTQMFCSPRNRAFRLQEGE
jgi:hypothetical protein